MARMTPAVRFIPCSPFLRARGQTPRLPRSRFDLNGEQTCDGSPRDLRGFLRPRTRWGPPGEARGRDARDAVSPIGRSEGKRKSDALANLPATERRQRIAMNAIHARKDE